ncbi:MAG: MG2 domain-containing protein, partial [Planctomycetota bacterium]
MTRISVPALTLLALFLMLGLTLPAVVQQDKEEQELPDDEKELYDYGVRWCNYSHWKQAEKAFNKYLKEFPEGRHFEDVVYRMAILNHHYARRYETAREWYRKYCEDYPKGGNYWAARLAVAQTFANRRNRKRAVEEYEKVLKDAPAEMKPNIIQQIWNLKGKRLNLYVNQSFTAGETPQVHVNGSGIDKAEMRLVRVSADDVREFLTAESPSVADAVAKARNRKVLKEWTETFEKQPRRWFNKIFHLEKAKESGIYVLEAEHERITMSVTVFVNRYGIITKSYAGKLLVFAQDRVSGKPLADMKVRIVHKEKGGEGKTDENGVFAADAFPQGAFVIGEKGGELIAASPYYYGYRGQQGKQALFYIATDRPIYRPNQKVRFKIIHRDEEGVQLHLEEGLKLNVFINDPKGNKVYEKKHVLGKFGSTDGEFTLGDEPPLGMYRIWVQSADKKQNEGRNWYPQYYRYGGQQIGMFRVDEYRKPEYEVNVTFEKKHYLQGEGITATIQADYYFGSPVPNAEVTYQVFRRPQYWYWRCLPHWCDWYMQEGEWGMGLMPHPGWGRGEMVSQSTGRTDEEGKLKVRVETEKQDYDAIYSVVAKVTDLSRRQVDGTGSVVASRAQFTMQISLDKYVYKPGGRIHLQVRAITPDEQPVADKKVKVVAFRRWWDKRKYQEERIFTGECRTNEHGIGDLKVNIEEQGSIYFRALAEDDLKNEVKAERYVWITSNSWGGANMNWNGIDIIPDKQAYAAGDTATFLITSQEKNMHILFSLEGKEVHHYEVIRVKGHTTTVEVKLDKAEYAPNVFATVVALHKSQMYQKRKSIVVDPSDRFITVEIKPDKDQYRPRDPATVVVTARDKDGNPVSAEVMLGIVDESIYALQPELVPDIRKFFIHRRWNQV